VPNDAAQLTNNIVITQNSAPLPSLAKDLAHNRAVLLVAVKKEYKVLDEETKDSLKQQRDAFVNANKHKDRKYEVHERLIIDGQVERLALVADNKDRPLWYSVMGYVLSVLLGLVFVYRMFVEMCVYDRAVWVCEKVVSVHMVDVNGRENVTQAEVVMGDDSVFPSC
jgi:hypothetical protein